MLRKLIMKSLVNLACVTLGVILGSVASVSYLNTRPDPAPVLDLGTMYVCAHEDGAGVGQEYPCTWDARIRGNGLHGLGSRPVLVYGLTLRQCRYELPAYAQCAYEPTE